MGTLPSSRVVLHGVVLATLLGALSVVALAGQDPQQPPPPLFKSGSKPIVSIFATVTDAQNRLVPELTRDDFQVFDNDKLQPLVVFDDQIQPISVVIMLDTSASMTNSIALLKQASEQFILRLLPADKAAVGAFNDKIEMSSDFTNNRDALIGHVKELDYGNATRLYDAVDESLAALEEVDGRKVVLVFTDGDDTGSRVSRNAVMEKARDAEVMIYAIGLESEFFDGMRVTRTKPDSGLRRLAEETGGGYFELKKTADLGPTFSRVAQELHSQYALGFEAPLLDGKVHKLTLKMKQPGMMGRGRRSYVATPEPAGGAAGRKK
jgi:Ca-activated chloride channel family protein